MAKKPTKRQRIDEKVAAGMDHITAEKEVIMEIATEQVEKLKAQQAREERKVEAEAVSVIREEFPNEWTHAMGVARERLDARRRTRAAAASKPRTGAHAAETEAPSASGVPDDVAGDPEQTYSY